VETLSNKETDDSVSEKDTQLALNALKACEEHLVSILKLLSNKLNPQAKKLFKQAFVKYEDLLIKHYSFLFENESLTQVTLPDSNKAGVYCQLLKDLYGKINLFQKKTDDSEIKLFPQQAIKQFIQSTTVSAEIWLELLKQQQKNHFLKMNQGFFYLTLFNHLAKSQKINLIIEAYTIGKSMAQEDPSFQTQITKEMQNLCLDILEQQVTLLLQKLELKKKEDKSPVHLINSTIQVLQQLSLLWFSPYCLLTVGDRFLTLSLLENIEPTIANVSELREVLTVHLQKQQQLLLTCQVKKPESRVKQYSNFSEYFDNLIIRINNCLAASDNKSTLSNILLKDLDKLQFTLEHCFNNGKITPNECMQIESRLFKVRKILINHYPSEVGNGLQVKLWSSLNERGALLERLISTYYFSAIIEQFQTVQLRQEKKKQKIALIKKDILEHYEAQFKKAKIKYYPAVHYQFINFLLEQIEKLSLADSAKNDMNLCTLIHEFKNFKTDIQAFENIEAIEKFLIHEVNRKNCLINQMRELFTKIDYPNVPLKNAVDHLKNQLTQVDNTAKIIAAWHQASKTLLSIINDINGKECLFGEASWFNQFIIDSNVLFQTLVTENEDQEDAIFDVEESLKSLLGQVRHTISVEKAEPLRQFIQTLSFATPHSNHYLFVNHILEQTKSTQVIQAIYKEWHEFVTNTLHVTQNLFELIHIDMGETYSKQDFYNELEKLIKPVYSWKEYNKQKEAVNALFKKLQTTIIALENSNKADNEVANTAIAYLQAVNFAQTLSVTNLKKMALSLKQVTKKDLEKLREFTTQWLIFQSNRNDSKQLNEIFYIDFITAHLTNLYRKQYQDSKVSQGEKSILINYADSLSQQSKKPEISLAIYLQLMGNEPTTQSISFVNALIKTSFQSTKEIITHLEDILINKDLVWQMPYLIGTMPLIFSDQLPKENWEKILVALVKPGAPASLKRRRSMSASTQKLVYAATKKKYFENGSFCIDYSTRLKLLQIMLALYVHTYVFKKLSKDHANRTCITRIVHHMDSIVNEGLQQESVTLQEKCLNELSADFHLIRKLLNKPLNKIALSDKGNEIIHKLLTPIEGKLLQSIEETKFSFICEKTLINQPVQQWERILRENYFNAICFSFLDSEKDQEDKCETNVFYNLFADAYSVAKNSDVTSKKQENNLREALDIASKQFGNECTWLAIVNNLLLAVNKKQLALKDVNLIFTSVVVTGKITHLQRLLVLTEYAQNAVKECLFDEYNDVIKQTIKNTKHQNKAIKLLKNIKHEIFNANIGHQFLQKLSHALLRYRKTYQSEVHYSYLNELLTLIVETKAYQEPHLLDSRNPFFLDDKYLLHWCYQLKQEKYIQLFNLQAYRTSKETVKLFHYLHQLEKEKPQFIKRFIALLKKSIHEFKQISALNEFVENFVRRRWDLDNSVLDALENRVTAEWYVYLNVKARLFFEGNPAEQADRTVTLIVDEMLKDVEGINKTIVHLIQRNNNKPSYLENTYGEIKQKYESEVKLWNEDQIKNWAATFKQAGVQLLNEHAKVVELVAVLMHASALKLNKVPRPTQVTAVLVYIDAIQKGKGRLANIYTGEGKTLVTAMAAIICGLRNEHVDIVTSNEVLAERDAKINESLFALFNLLG
ncbi:MAG: hypothetical protein ACK4PR_03645, partial [Gammaproteobacteria bacterium]